MLIAIPKGNTASYLRGKKTTPSESERRNVGTSPQTRERSAAIMARSDGSISDSGFPNSTVKDLESTNINRTPDPPEVPNTLLTQQARSSPEAAQVQLAAWCLLASPEAGELVVAARPQLQRLASAELPGAPARLAKALLRPAPQLDVVTN